MSDFKNFLIQNGVIGVTAGITIGIATASFIKSFVADIVLPIVFLIFVKGSNSISKDAGGFFSKFLSKKDFLFVNFVSELITWALIVLSSLIVLKIIYKRYVLPKVKATEEESHVSVAQEMMKHLNPFSEPIMIAPPNRQPLF